MAVNRNAARIQVGDIQIAFNEFGAGPPVVLIHGLGCGMRMWFHQVRALQDRFRVIIYDQRGHGSTDAFDDASRYSPAHLFKDLVGLLDALALKRVAVLGFSLGGGPALALASQMPERVSHLILADVGAGADDTWKSNWLAQRWAALAAEGNTDELIADMLRSEFFKVYARKGTRYRAHMAGLIRATPLVGLQHILREVTGKRRSLFRMSETLKSLKVATLIIRGHHDYVCRNATDILSKTIPGAKVRIIADSGHMTPLEQPARFNAVIGEFLAVPM